MIAGLPWWVVFPGIWPFGIVGAWAVLVGAVDGYRNVRGRLLERRRRSHDEAVAESKAAGYAAGEEAAFFGRLVEVSDLPLLPFRAGRPRRERSETIATNCERVWAASFLRGHAACTRAKLDAELGSIAAERFDDDIARIEAYANGEHRR